MTKVSLARAKARMEKAQRRNEVSRKEAVARGDTKTELALSEKIEDYNTILWALEVAQIAAQDGFESHILSRFERVD